MEHRQKDAPVRAAESVSADPAVDSDAFRATLGCFATGVTIVTARGPDDRPVGLTVTSFNSVSLDPPLILWSLKRASPNFAIFAEAKGFAVNILAADQTRLARRFATPLIDKFADLRCGRGAYDAPLLPGVAAQIECRSHMAYDGGDHVIFLGRVEHVRRWERPPLIFCSGSFMVAEPNPMEHWEEGPEGDED
ncbi:MAG: hypothetical protein CMM50_09965 [Rhodospirillaceae bacterium]|nr:hypothetical protein [Rhodospirillaceae bacterium]